MENQETNYFVLVNRLLTNLLASVIGLSITIGIYYMLIYAFSINLNELNFFSFVIKLILIIAALFGLTVYSIIQNYLYHLLEKEKYQNIGKNSGYSFVANLFFAVLFIVTGFILLTKSQFTPYFTISGFIACCIIFNHIVKEPKNLVLTFSNLAGTVIGLSLTSLLILSVVSQNLGLSIIFLLLSLPITAICISCIELLSITAYNLLNSVDTSNEQ